MLQTYNGKLKSILTLKSQYTLIKILKDNTEFLISRYKFSKIAVGIIHNNKNAII